MAFRFKIVCLALALLLFIPTAAIGAEKSLICYIRCSGGGGDVNYKHYKLFYLSLIPALNFSQKSLSVYCQAAPHRFSK